MSASKTQLLQSLLAQLEHHPDDRLVESLQNSLIENMEDRASRQAFVETAVELTAEETSRLTALINHQFPQVGDIIFLVSTDLISGLKIKIGDQVIDHSSHTALDLMKKTIL